MAESRDKIKSRMLRTVARMWDYPGVENEAAFDPLVALLINACAAELAKINRDKKLSQSRLTQEMARLLIPDAVTRAAPAHAIASALPSAAIDYIDKKETFLCSEENVDEDGPKMHFCPTARFPLMNAKIAFQASDNNLYKIIDHKYKNVLGYAKASHSLPALYLGIEIGEKIESVDEISFFFNILNSQRKDFFFKHLKNSRWFLGNQALEKQPGYPSTVNQEENLEELLKNRYKTNKKACRDINRFYKQQFFTLKNVKGLAAARGKMPQEIEHIFDEDTLKQVDNNLLWLKVELPNVVSPELLNDVFCFANCFPILNQQVHEEMFRIQDNLNILPLKSNDFFFDIKKIVDSNNVPYHLYNLNGKQTTEDNSVLLRTSGVGRFGAFEAKEELQYLFETLKDETASYASVGTETIESIVGEINILLGDLEEKIAEMTVDKMVSYLVMRNLKDTNNLYVEFWSTAGRRANNIAAGNKLEVMGRSNMQSQNTILITPTVGGKNRLSNEEKLTSFKRTLLANNRLVTAEDIKAFCKEQLGERVHDIKIKKGLANGLAIKEGLVRTIDIILTPNEKIETSSKEWDFLLEDIMNEIRARVAHSFPYRILLKEAVKKTSELTYNGVN